MADCQICQQPLDEPESALMRCAHAFHYECIMEWAEHKGAHCTTMAELWEDSRVKCPICKKTGVDIRLAEVFVFTNYDGELLRHRFLGVVCFSLLILSLSQISKP